MRHIAVVFTGLIDAAVDHVGHRQPVDIRVARHQRLQRDGAQVIGAHAAERAAVTAEGCADGVADKGLVHKVFQGSGFLGFWFAF